MRIYSGSSNPKLASRLSKITGYPLADIEISSFPNGETKIWINDKIDNEAIVVQSFSPNPDRMIIEYALLMDALRRGGADKIIVVIPWLGYCIQDKVFRQGEPLSAKVIAEIVQSTNPDKIITIDLHNEAIQGFFASRTKLLSAIPLFWEILKTIKLDCVISPDEGALKKSTKTAQALNLDIVTLNKRRDLNTGKVEFLGINGNVKGKSALITDDFISTGQTLTMAADYLKSQGVEKLYVAVTHHLFVSGVQEKLSKCGIDELFVTDTIAIPKDIIKNTDNFSTRILSVDKLIHDNL